MRYSRSDQDDITSSYHLSGYNITHTHPLVLRACLPIHLFEKRDNYQAFLNLKEAGNMSLKSAKTKKMEEEQH